MIKNYNEVVFNIENGGKPIHCVYSYIDKSNPLIVLPPQFEKTIRTNMVPMLYLINNGFNVLRFDNTFHNGNSFGKIEQYNLKSALNDLITVMDYVDESDEIESKSGIGLFGISISSRVIYRYLSSIPNKIDVLLSLVGVVDMQYTLKAISGIDVVGEALKDPATRYGIRKLIKYPVDWDNFLKILIDNEMHTIETTKADIDKINTPTYLIVSEKDKWVNIDDYHKTFSDNEKILKKTYKISNAGHELYKNPQAAEYAFHAIVGAFSEFWGRNNTEVIKPNIAEIIEHNRKERAREFKYAKP